MRVARLVVLALSATAFVGCQSSGVPEDTEPAVDVDRVELHDNAFDPPVVQVPAGTTMTWAFADGETAHNVVGVGFESDVASDGTFTHTFTEPGTYDYTCTLHSGMDGRVVVTEA